MGGRRRGGGGDGATCVRRAIGTSEADAADDGEAVGVWMDGRGAN